MAQRTTISAVQKILKGDWDGQDLQFAIDGATALMDDVVSKAAQYKSISYNSTLAERVEAYLAAWIYAMSDRPLVSKNTGKAGGSFAGQMTMGLESNSYGQTAMMLDTTRVLAAINKGAIVSTAWLGLYPSDQTDYEDKN